MLEADGGSSECEGVWGEADGGSSECEGVWGEATAPVTGGQSGPQ